MKSIKVERIDAEIKRELAGIIAYGTKDPRINEAMITVSSVSTTGDLKYAKVYVSIMADDKKAILKALQSGAGHFRSELSGRLRIRTVPELTFVLDESIEYGLKIEKLLSEIKISPETQED